MTQEMPNVSLADLETRPLNDLRAVLDDDRYERFHRVMHEAATRLEGRTVWNVNSTSEGGGVAEMLTTLLPYAVDAGWDIRWAIISGDAEFFDVTKALHNALHGTPPADEDVWTKADATYKQCIDANAGELVASVRSGDVVIIHDPQAAGLIRPLVDAGAVVSWQCHIGTDEPNDCTRRAWDFLRSYVEPADRYVFTRAEYLWEGLDRKRLRVIAPSIDPLSPKNAPLDDGRVEQILRNAGIPNDAKIVLEVSRWDRLKNPIGFVRMYDEHLSDRADVHLVYAGPSTNGVADDPESVSLLEACAELWRSLEPSVQERVHLLELPMDDIEENALMVNALQRRADVVVQMSLEEGFGLTVSEAMWKGRPVVGSRVGGIQDQIEHDRSGVLIDDPYDLEAFADAVRSLLDDPDRAARLGSAARERVSEHFLGPRQLSQYAELAIELTTTDRAA